MRRAGGVTIRPVRTVYLIAAISASVLVLSNAPRLPWISATEGVAGVLRGFSHGMVGFSWLATWLLIVGGVYQLILGVLYWDIDTTEQTRTMFTLESGGTARLLWVTGALCLGLGILYGVYIFRNDQYLWPAGVASSVFSLLTAWLYWLAFPLYEQVGIDRAEL